VITLGGKHYYLNLGHRLASGSVALRENRVDRSAKVELFEQIRREYEHGGETIRGIAKKLGIHWRMVREAVLSAVPVERKTPVRERPKLEPAVAFVDAVLEARQAGPPKAAAHCTSDLVPDSSGDAGSESGRVHDTTPRSRNGRSR
jgi:hypothetical protein